MEGKLIKTGDQFLLRNKEDEVIAITSGTMEGRMLSLKNCQAIENGYDLDEIKRKLFYGFDGQPSSFTTAAVEQTIRIMIEILGDKKFSENKLLVDFVYFLNDRHFNKYMVDTDEVDLYLESLQQTEWDVEIEMEQYVKYVPKSLATVYPTGGVRPKLDSNGCLILRRK